MGKRVIRFTCTLCHRPWASGHADVCLGPCPGCAERETRIAEMESWLPFSTERTRRDARELLGETWAYKPEGSLPGASVSVVRSGVALDVINTLIGSVDILLDRIAELEKRPTHESVAKWLKAYRAKFEEPTDE